MHPEVFCDALLVRAASVAATHQVIPLRKIRSGLIGRADETVLADVVALELGELRFLRPGRYRSVTAHADGIQCSIVIGPVVERRHGGDVVGQSGPFREHV
jgi:hypothetical protein